MNYAKLEACLLTLKHFFLRKMGKKCAHSNPKKILNYALSSPELVVVEAQHLGGEGETSEVARKMQRKNKEGHHFNASIIKS